MFGDELIIDFKNKTLISSKMSSKIRCLVYLLSANTVILKLNDNLYFKEFLIKI